VTTPLLATADDRRGRRNESSEPVKRVLGPHLLDDPDRRVRDQDAEEEGVPPVAERERDGAEGEQDQVEDREDIRANDACVRAARRRSRERLALRQQVCRFDLRKPSRRRLRLPG